MSAARMPATKSADVSATEATTADVSATETAATHVTAAATHVTTAATHVTAATTHVTAAATHVTAAAVTSSTVPRAVRYDRRHRQSSDRDTHQKLLKRCPKHGQPSPWVSVLRD